jgi:hypothetical protein
VAQNRRVRWREEKSVGNRSPDQIADLASGIAYSC